MIGGKIMTKNKLRVGLITTVSGRWPRELPRKRHEEYGKWISENMADVDLIPAEAIAVNNQDVQAIVKQFKKEALDLVIVLIGAFTGDFPCTHIAEELNVPIIMWAPREPAFDGGRIISNALTSATMNVAALKRLGFPYHFVYGNYDEPRVQKEVANYVKIYRVIKQMRNTYLGLIGYRPTGFYSSAFDETLIRKIFGVKIEEFDLVALFNKAKEIDDDLVKEDMDYLTNTVKFKNLPDGHLENHSRLKLALGEFAKEQGFDAITLRCWPELGNMKCTPCAIISRFADEGFIIGCEGDVDGTLTMLIQQYLTGDAPFMCDLIQINEEENTALLWHCGQAAKKLKDPNSEWLMANHPLAGQGVAVESTLKPGRVTIALMTKQGDKYKLFLTTGEALPTEKVTPGVMVNVRLDDPVLKTIYTIAEEGVPHHYSVVWADVAEEMKLLAKILNIEVIKINA